MGHKGLFVRLRSQEFFDGAKIERRKLCCLISMSKSVVHSGMILIAPGTNVDVAVRCFTSHSDGISVTRQSQADFATVGTNATHGSLRLLLNQPQLTHNW
jgi:hypothetical protein